MGNLDLNYLSQYLLPISIIVGGIIIGIIIEKIIFALIRKKSDKERGLNGEFAARSIKGIIILLFMIAGLYVAIDAIPMSKLVLKIFKKASMVVIIFSVTYVSARMAVGFIKLYSRKTEGVLSSTSIFVNLTKLLIYITGFTIILQSLGISITPILTALGIGGLAVALALQDTLSNLFAGLHIVASSQIRPGDYVRLEGGQEGYVTDITWRNTTIKVLPNNLIVVPNSKLSTNIITNYTLPDKQMSIIMDMTVSFDSDLNKVEETTIDTAKQVMEKVKGAVPGFEPVLRYSAFSDSGIKLSVIMRSADFNSQFLIKHEFIKRIQERFNQEKIKISYPVREVVTKTDA